MESSKLSESGNNLEKDLTPNTENAISQLNETANKTEVEEPTVGVVESESDTTPVVDEYKEDALKDYSNLSKSELIAELELLLTQPVEQAKDSVAAIKGVFFNLRKEEIAKEKAEFVANGNEESAFVVKPDEEEAKIKELLNAFKEKRAQYNAAQDAERAENLSKKQAIIDEINKIADDTDNINKEFSHVQQLQQDFKAIGEVPATNVTDLWKSYQAAVERFYDMLKINKELRDYDFKKNLEIKQQLCANAEALDEESNIVDAFKKLQALHDEWREVGPVAKEIREELWARFKNASVVINKKYQAFFENRKAEEKANADAKTGLCEQIEAISIDDLNSHNAWNDATKKIIELQAQWSKLGYASRKQNVELFARFRKSCDEFFEKKAEYFKAVKDQFAENLAKKNELVEKAESLKDSTDWKKATDAFVALQKEWKTVGPVAKKYSDNVWKRFIAACDYFFEEKKKQTSSVRTIEHENLKNKKKIIAAINEAVGSDDTKAAAQQVRELMSQWQAVGHVPFKEKDKIYADYKEALDKAFEKLDMNGSRANLANFENSISQINGSDKVQHERERLVRQYEQKCNELKTYENNLGFLTASSSNGNSLVKEIEKKLSKLKGEIELLEKKIKFIDEKI